MGELVLRGYPKGNLNPQTILSTIVLDRRARSPLAALTALNEEDHHTEIDPLIAEK